MATRDVPRGWLAGRARHMSCGCLDKHLELFIRQTYLKCVGSTSDRHLVVVLTSISSFQGCGRIAAWRSLNRSNSGLCIEVLAAVNFRFKRLCQRQERRANCNLQARGWCGGATNVSCSHAVRCAKPMFKLTNKFPQPQAEFGT